MRYPDLVYIAYMGPLPQHPYSPALHHTKIIEEIVHPSFANNSLIRSLTRSFNAFSANLTEEEKDKLMRIDGVVSVFPCIRLHLQTTRSFDFMGLSDFIERNLAIESNMIIGMLDSGIWPESESFSDKGFGPIPDKWKGVCEGGANFSCNRKIIGARSYSLESMDLSARDNTGHGSHCASIAAGNNVDASYFGIAQGLAKGGVPSARLAVYKVCDPHCYSTDILAAFDDAIADGVDVISISIGFNETLGVYSDPIAIGALHAVAQNILTINAAGNNGPHLSTITTDAPWIFTVAASDIDRRVVDKVQLGKYATLVGNGINAFPSSEGALPLVYGSDVSSKCSEMDARNCLEQCLDRSLVKDKVVLCDAVPKLEDVRAAGALACIVPNLGVNMSKIEPFSVVRLSRNGLNLVKSYMTSTIAPEVQVLKSEAIYNPGAPSVALSSARGPGTSIPDILKPDITAPGVEILGAFSPLASPSNTYFDKRSVNYNILSGTSMACPHVTAAATYVKTVHPNWSPSAIKSALMTTAWEYNAALYPEAEFAYGSGHIDPLNAVNPGLVYETPVEVYYNIWCNISRTAGSLTATNSSCPMQLAIKDINHPSMSAKLGMQYTFEVKFPRTVTNVGVANSTYVASIEGDRSNLHFIVEPSTLQFTRLNQKLNFVVIVKGKRMKPQTMRRASLVWTDGIHRVRSPIVVHTFGSISAGERAQTPSVFCITFVIIVIMVLV